MIDKKTIMGLSDRFNDEYGGVLTLKELGIQLNNIGLFWIEKEWIQLIPRNTWYLIYLDLCKKDKITDIKTIDELDEYNKLLGHVLMNDMWLGLRIGPNRLFKDEIRSSLRLELTGKTDYEMLKKHLKLYKDKNTFDFKAGDVIEFCNDKFVVIENHGVSGTVKELNSPQIINHFRWVIGDYKSVIVE